MPNDLNLLIKNCLACQKGIFQTKLFLFDKSIYEDTDVGGVVIMQII